MWAGGAAAQLYAICFDDGAAQTADEITDVFIWGARHLRPGLFRVRAIGQLFIRFKKKNPLARCLQGLRAPSRSSSIEPRPLSPRGHCAAIHVQSTRN